MTEKELWESWISNFIGRVVDVPFEWKKVMEKDNFGSEKIVQEFIDRHGNGKLLEVAKSVDKIVTTVAEALSYKK